MRAAFPFRSALVLAPLALFACDHDGAPPPATTAASTTAAAAPAAPAAPAGPTTTGPLAVGSPPPDFTKNAQDGSPVHLAALKGKPVVVYFYPKDETPGCTHEACAFRDAWDALSKKGVVLIGISADTDESHKAFASNHKLPFLFVSDPSGAIAKSFGVPFDGGYTARQSFVIGADGMLQKIYRQVDVKVHAQEILADLP